MFKYVLYPLLTIILIILVVISLITVRFYKDKRAERQFLAEYKLGKMQDIGQVANLKILPLIDYYSSNDKLVGESGVSYLIEADQKKILFDVGFNRENLHPSPLLKNMQELSILPSELDSVFISHLHVDHVGGPKAKKESTFAISGEDIDMKGIKAYTPTQMVHKSAGIEIITKPTKIAAGIVSLGPIKRAIWAMGLTDEQALAINVKDKGIVLIVGCGHQSIEKVIEQTEQLFDIPIYAVLGGLHFPVTKRQGDPVFNIRRYIGTGTLPWQGIKESGVNNTIEFLKNKNIRYIGISAHDSCDWTLDRFRDSFGDNYIDILVGKVITM